MFKGIHSYHGVLFAVAWLVLGPVDPASASRVYEEEEVRIPLFTFLRPAKSTPEAQLAYADELRKNDRPRGARRQYRALVRYWPQSPEAPRAQYGYARLIEERGRKARAFDEYEKLIDNYAGQFPYREILERQFAIAESYLKERRGRILFFRGYTSPERAVPKLESLLRNAPQWERAPEAQYLLGHAYEEKQQYELAAHAYETVQTRHARSAFVEEAAFGKARVLYRIAREQRNYDQAAETALIAVNMFLRSHPHSEHADTARAYRETLAEQRARIAYDKAAFYDRIARRPRAALMAYELLVENFPQSEWTDIAESRMADLRSKLENEREN